MPHCNTELEDGHLDEDALIGEHFTFHHLGLVLGAVFGLLSVATSFYLIAQHARHYSRPWEQRHIIRILFMIPIYAVVSFLSFVFYRKAIYFEVLRDCYEAFAISSFFALLCAYVARDLHEQKIYFRGVRPVNWFWSMFGLQKCTGGEDKGILRKPRSGLTWFNVIWLGIFQYCFIRVFFTIVSVITQPFGRYCASSYSPAFAHIWTVGFECLSVTIAMFMVVQFYIQLKTDLAEHKPGIKVLSIKLVIFFSFWQTMVISFLASERGPLQPTGKLGYQDIKIGIPSVILIIEMSLFSVLHIFAYPWKPYSHEHNPPVTSSESYQGGRFGLRAFADAFNPWDIVKASARGFRWMFIGVRKRHMDPSYQPSKLGVGETGYMGPTYAMGGDGAADIPPPRRSKGNTAEEDRAGLLHDAQAPAHVHIPQSGPYHPLTNEFETVGNDGHIDLGVSRQTSSSPWASNWKPSDIAHDDSDDDYERGVREGFHPGMGPPPGTGLVVGASGSVHPAHRGERVDVPVGGGWNHWGGVKRDSLDEGRYGR